MDTCELRQGSLKQAGVLSGGSPAGPVRRRLPRQLSQLCPWLTSEHCSCDCVFPITWGQSHHDPYNKGNGAL